jgi:hypothetical protein
MREREIEQYFIRRVREAGGLQRKFVSPGHKGVPDQIVIYMGHVNFVELKAPGKLLRADQVREHKKLRDAGANVWTVDSKDAVDYFIERMTR